MEFSDLDEGKQYLIRLEPRYKSEDVYRVSILMKGNNSCLLVTYNENDGSSYKKWVEYSHDNFEELIEDLTPFYRESKIDDLLRDNS